MNLPNTITLGRLLITGGYVAAASRPGVEMATLALASFSVAAATDWLDGHLARKMNLVTSLGKLLDPLVDKILICSAFLHLSVVQLCPMWVAALIIGREFLVTGLRQIAVERGVVIAADGLGKWKTISQIVFVIQGLLWLRYPEAGAQWEVIGALCDPSGFYFSAVLYVALFMTLLSGMNYLKASRTLLSDSAT